MIILIALLLILASCNKPKPEPELIERPKDNVAVFMDLTYTPLNNGLK